MSPQHPTRHEPPSGRPGEPEARMGAERRVLALYRTAGPLVLGVFLLYGLVGLGLIPDPIYWRVPDGLGTLAVIVLSALALGAPVLLLLSLLWGYRLRRRPAVALPLWLLAATFAVLLASALLVPTTGAADAAEPLQMLGLALLFAAAVWATWIGYGRASRR